MNQAQGSSSQDRTHYAVDAAVSAAFEFLLRSRTAVGWWQDFPVYVGMGDEYVTAYVGTVLAQVADERAQQAARAGWDLLLTRRTISDGWGWNEKLLMDADSTAWGMRLAQAVGELDSERARGARQYLARHIQPDGGIAAYDEKDLFPNPDSARNELDYSGWFQSHACVTAGAAAVDGFHEPMHDYLRATQRADGSWKSYWWCDHEFVTALAAQELADRTEKDRERVARAAAWALARLGVRAYVTYPERPGGAVFPTACCLHVLVRAPEFAAVRATAERTLNWLLSNQRADGSWSPSARTRITRTDALDADQDSRGSVVELDLRRNFTTATVLQTLLLARVRLNSTAA